MAVQKTITYVDAGGVTRTTNVTIDLKKYAFGSQVDDEQVYLEITAPNIPATGIWRRNIDKLCEDGLFTYNWNNSVTPVLSAAQQVAASGTRFINHYSSVANIDRGQGWGQRFLSAGASAYDVSGVIPQLQVMT